MTPTSTSAPSLMGRLMLVASAVAVVALGCSAGPSDAGTPVSPDGGLEVAPRALAIRAELARQRHDAGALYVVVTLANGVDGLPAPLNPALASVRTADGILHTGQSIEERDAWIVADAGYKPPGVTSQLAGGASLHGWILAFDADAYASAPVEITYAIPGQTASGDGGASVTVGDGRSASAPVLLDPCHPCAGECTYLDRDARNCGTCGHTAATKEEASCRDGKLTCATPTLTACGPDSAATCVDLATSWGNCGSCGNTVEGGCALGKPICSGGRTLYLAPDPGTGPKWRCADLAKDPENCGAIGHDCAAVAPVGKLKECRASKCGGKITVVNSASTSTSCAAECSKLGLTCDNTWFSDSKGGVGGELFHAYESSHAYPCDNAITMSFDSSYAECGCTQN